MGTQQPSLFTRFAKWTSSVTGKPATFIISVLVVVVWAITGPVFGFSDTWQLVINTGTTIITFLMVFLIQNTQNRDSTAVQLKLDELICAIKEANDEFLDVEDLDDRELDRKRQEMVARAEKAKNNVEDITKTNGDQAA
jgi:low affinity Fe/Cu permease